MNNISDNYSFLQEEKRRKGEGEKR